MTPCLPLLLLLLLGICHLGMTQDLSTAPVAAGPTGPTGPTGTAGLANEGKEEEEEVETCGKDPIFKPEALRLIGGAVERLGVQLLEKLPAGPQQPNVIISPLSLSLALAQLALGARNDTERLLLTSIHGTNIPCYHHTLERLLRHLSNTTLQVASRMYLRKGFDVKLAFVEESLARYRSSPAPLLSVDEINQWVKNATNGHIANFLESVPHDVVLMLVNAMFFKGVWQNRFDPQATTKGVFYLDNQNSVSVDMMKSAQYPLRLLDEPELEAQVASFPFKGNISFLVVQPLPGKGNVSSLLSKLNISDLYRRLPPERKMQVNLPKFRLQYRQELQEALTGLGLGSLFSGPDLSRISDLPLKVTGVLHASEVELSEEGAEASAATVITAMRSVSLFSLNTPFLFALVDDASLAPFFLGVVTNPAPDDAPMANDDPSGNVTQREEPVSDNSETKALHSPQSDDPLARPSDCSVEPCAATTNETERKPCLNGSGVTVVENEQREKEGCPNPSNSVAA